MTAAKAHRGTEVINITDSDHAEEVYTLNFHCVAICAYLQKGDTDNPQSENHISKVSADVQDQYTNDEPFGIFEAEHTEKVLILV